MAELAPSPITDKIFPLDHDIVFGIASRLAREPDAYIRVGNTTKRDNPGFADAAESLQDVWDIDAGGGALAFEKGFFLGYKAVLLQAAKRGVQLPTVVSDDHFTSYFEILEASHVDGAGYIKAHTEANAADQHYKKFAIVESMRGGVCGTPVTPQAFLLGAFSVHDLTTYACQRYDKEQAEAAEVQALENLFQLAS